MARKTGPKNITNSILLIAGALLLALTIGWPLAAQYRIQPAVGELAGRTDQPLIPAAAPAIQPKTDDRAKEDRAFLGTVIARETVDIAAKFDGRLENVNYALG